MSIIESFFVHIFDHGHQIDYPAKGSSLAIVAENIYVAELHKDKEESDRHVFPGKKVKGM